MEVSKEYARSVCREVEAVENALDEFSGLGNVLSDEYKALLKSFLGHLAKVSERTASGDSNPVQIQNAILAYRKLRNLWLGQAVRSGMNTGCGPQEVLLDLILGDNHLFLTQAEAHPFSELHPRLVEAMRADLRIVQKLAGADWSTWMDRLCGMEHEEESGAHCVQGLSDGIRPPWDISAEREDLKRRISRSADWGDRVEDIADFVFSHGHRSFCGCPAFRLRPPDQPEVLEPIGGFSHFPLEWLEGNRGRVELIERNTLNLLDGFKANNVLIWGPRGCGKTTLIRALISKYYGTGLRGIEISPHTYGRLTDLFDLVRRRREYFIGVLDNISLIGRDSSLHLLSSVLDGGLDPLPQNLVFYATSNFKDLVDREGARNQRWGGMQLDEGEDVSPNLVDQGLQPGIYDPQQAERLDEQRALDDRFGLKVFMDMPRKTEYEHMVLSYARRAGIDVDRDELLAAFKVWCMRHNHDLVGGRTARDFIVDFLPPFVRKTSRGN